jgi:hypothetical protein
LREDAGTNVALEAIGPNSSMKRRLTDMGNNKLGDARGIAPRPIEAADDAEPDRIACHREHDRNGGCGRLGGTSAPLVRARLTNEDVIGEERYIKVVVVS